MPPLVSLRNDVSEEETLQKFHTGVSCVTAQIRENKINRLDILQITLVKI